MKTFILILLLSFPAFAQYKVEVLEWNSDTLLGRGEFATLEEANKWIEENPGTGALGKKEEIVPLDGASDEQRARAIEVVPAEGEEGKPDYIPSRLRLRKTYKVVGPIDVTAERQAEATAQAQKLQEKQSAKARLKEFDDTKSYTAAQLKTFIKALIESED